MPPSRVAHLGDFHVPPRVVAITALAIPVGAASALVAVALLKLIALFTNLCFYGRFAFGTTAPHGTAHPWLLLVMPVVGGLVIGVMARFGSEKIRGHGMPEAIESILVGGSRVQPRVAVLKPLSAAISIGTGGPFGAEGPIIMTGGAVGRPCRPPRGAARRTPLAFRLRRRRSLIVASGGARLADESVEPRSASVD
ncbi:chloride channel protein [Streptomyces sp. BR1]|uniref:chloride channel protein n=1 Tax=Streptomyces sp. BR1 TaxID=1592323 RepID=UPI00402BE2C6